MNLLQTVDLSVLINQHFPNCVSLYMPTSSTGAGTQEDKIRFKNLLKQATEELGKRGVAQEKAKSMLQSARDLHADNMFWKHQSNGLAVFISPTTFRYYRLPLNFRELVSITDHFYLKPLMPLFSGDGRFYVLTLGQHHVKLYQGSHYSLREQTLNGTPTSIEDILQYDVVEKQMQYRTVDSSGGNRQPSMFPSHADADDARKHKKDLQRFAQTVEKGVQKKLANEQAPLVLAGGEYLQSAFKETSSYHHIIDQGITVNPENLSIDDLHEQAWKIVEPQFKHEIEQAMGEYGHLSPQDKASNDLAAVVAGARQGRVKVLFAEKDQQRWGKYDPNRDCFLIHSQQEENDEDLIDLAVIHTLTNKGKVYVLDRNEMPDEGPIAATFKY